MSKIYCFSCKSRMSDWSKVITCSYVLADDEIEAEVIIKRWVKTELKKQYPKLEERDNDLLLCEVQPEVWLLAKGIINTDFKSKLDWAERDVIKGITEGKPLRQSLSMVLCAIAEEAYHRGRKSITESATQ